MTERQGRLASKIQGYEGKDQKTSQSLSSVCSWVPTRESEASKRWEESWWWGDRSSSSPGQWQNSNYRQRWHVMESFTLQLYRKGSRQNTCINTLYDRRDREWKERWNASSATAISPCLGYQERGEPNARETDVLLCRRQAGHFRAKPVVAGQLLCPGRCLGLSFPLALMDRQRARTEDQCWMLPATIPRISSYVFISICNMYIDSAAFRLKISQNKELPQQPLLQKQRMITNVNSQPAAPYHKDQPTSRSSRKAALKSTALSRAFWSPSWHPQAVHRERLPSHTERTCARPRSLPTATTLPVPRGQQTVSSWVFQRCGLWSGVFLS